MFTRDRLQMCTNRNLDQICLHGIYAGTVLKPVRRAVPMAESKPQHSFMAQKILQYTCAGHHWD